MESKHDTKYFQSLIGRAELTENILKSIQNKSSGNDGENYFSAILDCVTDIVYLNDFQFTYNSQVQIDTIVIDDHAIYLFEIKNYKGIYYLEDTLLKNNFGSSFTSPFIQMERARNEFNKLCHYLEIGKPVISKLVFTNPYFNFKNRNLLKDQVILPSELGSITQLFKNQNQSENIKIKQKLLTARNSFDAQYSKGVTIPFEHIKPGIKCPRCHRMFTVKIEQDKQKCTCQYCESVMDKKYLYEYNLQELYYLKQEPFTITEAVWWLGGNSKTTIRRVCEQNFKSIGKRYKKFYI
ncbi:NERD domain-containing protein [Mammaliicoccus sciuri]|uniref:nuclease-related domain-containing protein n=1 Tax=Mammaliicoccus sciuri TaxID=1296 RepID=UPI001E55B72B|nr:nuclease-related domain-containing protein [Mammaliicoccus sciuri]MCD8875380.1 NERD domain-containing protein [Mammaliicoccus sciuri]